LLRAKKKSLKFTIDSPNILKTIFQQSKPSKEKYF
jgi:hypothetical protein